MSYPGNPSLPPEVRQRILDTFDHTLATAAKGSLEEARLGCDFILRLDPLFAPAQRLNDRLAGASGPVPVEDLRESPAAGFPAGEPELEELPELAPLDDTGSVAGDLREEMETLLAARDFDGLARRAEAAGPAIASDPELQALLARAQEQMETAHFVETFLEQAAAAAADGRLDDARSLLGKARALDPTHPRIGSMEAALDASGSETVAIPVLSAAAPEPGRPEPGIADDLPELGAFDLEAVDAMPAIEDAGSALDGGFDLEPPALDELPALDLGGGGVADDFAAGALEQESDPRIRELLEEGQQAFERGEHQAAIDAWSRVFLIDIDHAEAARRIEMARGIKAETEREAEEAYHEGVEKAEAGDLDGARGDLGRALELAPGHLAAREALDRLDRGEPIGAAREEPVPEPAAMPVAAPPPAAPPEQEILVPPEPGAAPRPAAPAKAPKARRGRRPGLFPILAAAVLVLVAAGAWYLFSERDRVFPNREEAAPAAAETTPIDRARQLHEEGKGSLALAQLKRVPPASPFYDEAQALIAEWDVPEAVETPDLPEADLARREDLLASAAERADAGRHLEALPLLREARTIAPLAGEEEALLQRVETALRPLDEQLALVRGGEYDRVLRDLWLLHEKNPADQDVTALLVTSYYNLGVTNLQQGRPGEAQEMLSEALRIAPADPDVRRLADLAKTYDGRSEDLLYRIFVKYLSPRTV